MSPFSRKKVYGGESKGRSAVYGDDLYWQQLQATVTYLQNQVFSSAMNDSAYRDAVGGWRHCLNEKGHDYEQPLAAGEALRDAVLRGELDLVSLRSMEIEVATADAQCFRETGMDDVVATLMREYESQMVDANQGVIREFTELQKQAIAQAHTIVDSGHR
jgi:hypothetical protein